MNDTALAKRPVLARGTLTFSIESRLLRELGERLVKQPEVAVVELIKNAYDADASECTVECDPQDSIVVADDGIGMTLDRFTNGWMRVGTSSKKAISVTEKFSRLITGEKGIGRFAVRFLGRELHLESVADDPTRGVRTRLTAYFDWPRFDRQEDLGKLPVPYELFEVDGTTPTGTKLVITRLRSEAVRLNQNTIRTSSIGMLTPLRSLFRQISDGADVKVKDNASDPGFILDVRTEDLDDESRDVAAQILDAFVLRAQLRLDGNKIDLNVYRRGAADPCFRIVDTYPNQIQKLHADIRFFPRRTGTFTSLNFLNRSYRI